MNAAPRYPPGGYRWWWAYRHPRVAMTIYVAMLPAVMIYGAMAGAWQHATECAEQIVYEWRRKKP